MPVLGTSDPVELFAYMKAGGFGSINLLAQAYGSSGYFNNPMAFINRIDELGISNSEAIQMIKEFGYTPVQTGSLLWSLGYNLEYVKSVIDSEKLENKHRDYVMLLKRLTDCSTAGLAEFPICASGDSTFTTDDFINEVLKANYVENNDCSVFASKCLNAIEDMIAAGYSAETIIIKLFTDYKLTYKTLGTALYQYTENNTGSKVVQFISQEPFSASLEQMVETFTGINGLLREMVPAIAEVYPDVERILKTMRLAGYDATQIGSLFISKVDNPWVMYQLLRSLGFSSSESNAAVAKLNPHRLKEHEFYVGPVGAGFKYLFIAIGNL